MSLEKLRRNNNFGEIMGNIYNYDKEAEERFLEHLLEDIKKKIETVESEIDSNDDEIQKMDEYYWENYNEFDEYGYEHFDNRQNRLMKASEKADRIRERHKLIKMTDSPYFARIDLIRTIVYKMYGPVFPSNEINLSRSNT